MSKGKIILNVDSGNNSIESTFNKERTINCLANLGDLLNQEYQGLKFKRIKK